MTIKQIKSELDTLNISYKGVTLKQELLNLIPEYAEARREKGYLTEDGLRWLFINIANLAGFDKLSFAEREKKGKEIAFIGYYEDAESPTMLRNALADYDTYLRGEPVNGLIGLDFSNQAMQLYALLTSDETTAKFCNLNNGDNLVDGYKIIADRMNEESGLNIFNRKNCKKAVMTTLYSKANVGEVMLSEDLLHTDGVLQEHEAEDLNELFQHSFQIEAPEAKEAMEQLLKLNDENIGVYNWTMPDGFKVKYDVKSTHEIHIQGESKDGIFLEFKQEVKRYAPSEHNRGMSPNIIHSFDGYILRQFERQFKQFFSTIHDEISIPYNYAEEAIQIVNNIYCELNDNDYLKDITQQIKGEEVDSLNKCTLTNEMIRGSKYKIS